MQNNFRLWIKSAKNNSMDTIVHVWMLGQIINISRTKVNLKHFFRNHLFFDFDWKVVFKWVVDWYSIHTSSYDVWK